MQALRGAFHNLDVQLLLEPGRWLIGPAGVLLASVVLLKGNERFVVIDAATGMPLSRWKAAI